MDSLGIWPIRCFSCGKVIFQEDYETYSNILKKNYSLDFSINFQLLEDLNSRGYFRFCCKNMLLTSTSLKEEKELN